MNSAMPGSGEPSLTSPGRPGKPQARDAPPGPGRLPQAPARATIGPRPPGCRRPAARACRCRAVQGDTPMRPMAAIATTLALLVPGLSLAQDAM